MPNRYLRDSIRTSRSLSMISWLAEVLFLHLLVAVDDYGRYMAEIPILRGQLFSLRTGLADEMLSEALGELEKEGVIRRYHANGREYLQIMNWYLYQKPRAKNSKFPDPPFAVPQRCEQMHADVADNDHEGDNDHGNDHGPDSGNAKQSVSAILREGAL